MHRDCLFLQCYHSLAHTVPSRLVRSSRQVRESLRFRATLVNVVSSLLRTASKALRCPSTRVVVACDCLEAALPETGLARACPLSLPFASDSVIRRFRVANSSNVRLRVFVPSLPSRIRSLSRSGFSISCCNPSTLAVSLLGARRKRIGESAAFYISESSTIPFQR